MFSIPNQFRAHLRAGNVKHARAVALKPFSNWAIRARPITIIRLR